MRGRVEIADTTNTEDSEDTVDKTGKTNKPDASNEGPGLKDGPLKPIIRSIKQSKLPLT